MAVKADITIDIDKQVGNLQNLTNIYNARVGDNKTPLTVLWQKNGMALNLKGLHAFIAGKVGDGSYNSETDKVDFPVGTPVVKYEDDGSGTLDNGQSGLTTLLIPKQMWSKTGLFAGYIGLKDENGSVFTSKDIFFKVLGNVLDAGVAINYFIDDFSKVIQNSKLKLQENIDDARNTYESETKNAHDSLDALKAQIQANRDEQNTLVERLIGVKQQIDANDIVKKYVYDDYVKKNEARLDATSQSITDQLKNLKLDLQFTTLNDLKTEYPNGSSGVYILENGNLAVYQNNQWSDSGKLVITNGANYRMFVTQDQIVTPYDSLNTLPTNSITVYGNLTIDNNPIANDSIIVLTLGPTEKDYQFNYVCMQFVFGQNINDALCRMCWVNADKTRSWKPWNKITNCSAL